MIRRIESWFASCGWSPFDFQRETWEAYRSGSSGLIHAPTGYGKTYAAWLGPVLSSAKAPSDSEAGSVSSRTKRGVRDRAAPFTVLWLTPLRALANDTVSSLAAPIEAMGLNWTIEKRTGDTAYSLKKKQRERLPTALVTTPESLSVFSSYPESSRTLGSVQMIVVDEWHELLSTKRGVQTELALARLRTIAPGVRTWGLSATLGNLDEALESLVGVSETNTRVVRGLAPKQIEVETLIPESIERFPWSGHLGIRLVDQTIAQIEKAKTTLLFCNTRSQAEIWYRRLLERRPEWMCGTDGAGAGGVALHHGSLEKSLRTRVEQMISAGLLKCVVCTSSLDLGVDFTPVEQVIQVGSPRGIARLVQRAGRSGHSPGAISRVVCVPTNAMELIEFSAARGAINGGQVEQRKPLELALDVLVQHLVTVAMGDGFDEDVLRDEVRSTRAFASLTDEQWTWCMDFVHRGGRALGAYPQYAKIRKDGEGTWRAADARIAQLHRFSIGTIASQPAMQVRFGSGKVLGTVEDGFAARIKPGDRFFFAGRLLELVRVRNLTLHVRVAKRKSGIVPRWNGGRFPLSTQLARAVRLRLDEARRHEFVDDEMRAVQPLLELQSQWSRLPSPDELLVERIKTRDGFHLFCYPFEGRLAHEGLGALLAYRLTMSSPRTVTSTANDYGIELLSDTPFDAGEAELRVLLSPERLVEDMLSCLDATMLARRQFRDIARVAGLVVPGYPRAQRSARQLQASSELFFDVFTEFDPENLLLDQARREVLEAQLEITRLAQALEVINLRSIEIVDPDGLTPLSFPLWAEHLRSNEVTSESWNSRVSKMVVNLERKATDTKRGRRRAAVEVPGD